MLDSTFSSVQIQAAILDILINFLCCLQESVLNIFTSFSTVIMFKVISVDIIIKAVLPGLYKHEAIFISKLLSLLISDIPLGFKITFVSNQENHLQSFLARTGPSIKLYSPTHSVWVGQVSGIRQPRAEMVVS